jgi:Asp-tRNA(Asn)/Glu-tRNA(Gln) amidotransferase A subunit family amidase
VELLQNAGADIVGKSNCDEFGMGYVPQFSLDKALGLIRDISAQ